MQTLLLAAADYSIDTLAWGGLSEGLIDGMLKIDGLTETTVNSVMLGYECASGENDPTQPSA